jgi:molecular chaperone GrpE
MNTRRWTGQEVTARATQDLRALLKQLLEVVDNLDRVLEVPGEDDAILDGIRITRRQLESILEKAGVRRIEVQPGQAFDPALHEALEVRRGSVDQPQASGVVMPGYMHHDAPLRPAGVIVVQ